MNTVPMFRIKDRTALVTGASGGLGAAIATALHGAGARVALSGTRAGSLAALATTLGERARPFPADLGDPEATRNLVNTVDRDLGPVDILVNNAGITRDGLALRMRDDDWNTVLEVNLTASFRLVRSALRGRLRRRHGRIVNISSVSGVTGNPGQSNYAASKAGLIGMSKALALEVAARGITVNCIAPGFIETAMTEAIGEDQRDAIRRQIPLGRFGTPEDVAAAVVYLASDEASYVTGHTLIVGGGLALG